MQFFHFALWHIHYVHRNTRGSNHWVTNITPLRGWKRFSWNYCHVERKRNISWGRLEILRYAQDDKWSHSCKLLVVRCSWKTTLPLPLSWQVRSETIRRPYWRAKVSPLRGDLEGSSRLNMGNVPAPALFPEREWSGRSRQRHKSLTRQWVGGGTLRWV
jgi:hypothetical protein